MPHHSIFNVAAGANIVRTIRCNPFIYQKVLPVAERFETHIPYGELICADDSENVYVYSNGTIYVVKNEAVVHQIDRMVEIDPHRGGYCDGSVLYFADRHDQMYALRLDNREPATPINCFLHGRILFCNSRNLVSQLTNGCVMYSIGTEIVRYDRGQHVVISIDGKISLEFDADSLITMSQQIIVEYQPLTDELLYLDVTDENEVVQVDCSLIYEYENLVSDGDDDGAYTIESIDDGDHYPTSPLLSKTPPPISSALSYF